jgi:hypothetical protein
MNGDFGLFVFFLPLWLPAKSAAVDYASEPGFRLASDKNIFRNRQLRDRGQLLGDDRDTRAQRRPKQ